MPMSIWSGNSLQQPVEGWRVLPPSGPAELLCRLACLGLTDVKDAADPTCGSGSLLLRLKNYANVRNYYGQELTSTTSITLPEWIWSFVAFLTAISISTTVTLWSMTTSVTWSSVFGLPILRILQSGLAIWVSWKIPGSTNTAALPWRARLTLLLHSTWSTWTRTDELLCCCLYGVLFRGATEEVIRKHLIQKLNVLDAVIGLPANLFFGTGIPVCPCSQERAQRKFRQHSVHWCFNDFEAGKNQNILRECDIDKIVETYERREDVDKYAHVATMQEIEENGFNLNIPPICWYLWAGRRNWPERSSCGDPQAAKWNQGDWCRAENRFWRTGTWFPVWSGGQIIMANVSLK